MYSVNIFMENKDTEKSKVSVLKTQKSEIERLREEDAKFAEQWYKSIPAAVRYKEVTNKKYQAELEKNLQELLNV